MPQAGRAYVPAALVPLSPAQEEAIARQLVSVYAEAESRIIALLGKGDITSWRRAFAQQQLAQVHGLMEALGKATEEYARYWMPTLYDHGLSIADGYLMQPEWVEPYLRLRQQGMDHMSAVGEINRLSGQTGPGGLSVAAHPGQITPMDLRFTSVHTDSIQQLAENLVRPLGEARNYAAQRIEDMVARARRLGNNAAAWGRQLTIRNTALESLQRSYLLGATPRQAAKAFRADLKSHGIESFVDKAGRRWNMRVYTDMVVNTMVAECDQAAITNRLMERGHDLVRVTDNAEECERCRPWEGTILSLTGKTEGYNTVNEALDAGLRHPRCHHHLLPYISRIREQRSAYAAEQAAKQETR